MPSELSAIVSQPSWLACFMAEHHHPAVITSMRLLIPDDLPALLFLERYCFNPCLAFGVRRWRYLLTKSVGHTIGIFHADQLIGYLCLLPHRGWQAVEIRSLAVHWSFRGQGIGQWLLQVAKAQTRVWQLEKLCLSVDCENDAALRLYPQLGSLQASHLLEHYYGLDRHALRQHYFI